MSLMSKVTVVRPRHVVWGALWMFLFASGGVIQTHLRFSERDLEIQTRRAQEEYASLADRRAELETRVASLRTSEEIRKRATEELGLVMPSPSDVQRLAVGDPLWVKYQEAGERVDWTAVDTSGMEPAWRQWIEDTMRVSEPASGAP